MTRVELTVIGRPQPAGSKRAFAVRRDGKPTGKIAVVEDAKRSRPWQALVIDAAHQAAGEELQGPLQLEVDFYVARPAGHYGTGRNRDRLKPSAPPYPATRPDVTKLLRGVEDAITNAGVWHDDAQIVTQIARKRYGHPERAEIAIETIAPAPAPDCPYCAPDELCALCLAAAGLFDA